jgi:HD superfamily phosphodiesterase
MAMLKVSKLYNHPLYQVYLKKIEAYETDRIYCRHDLSHFLDVARITWIYCLEGGKDYSKEVVYACGLLHDIGRWCQYASGEAHHKASTRLSVDLLIEAGFTESEQSLVIEVISAHRDEEKMKANDLGGIFYRADKASRACHNCSASGSCDWSLDKKNKTIEV